MTTNQILGVVVVLIPFTIMIIFMVKDLGLKWGLIILGSALSLIGCVFLGIYLIFGQVSERDKLLSKYGIVKGPKVVMRDSRCKISFHEADEVAMGVKCATWVLLREYPTPLGAATDHIGVYSLSISERSFIRETILKHGKPWEMTTYGMGKIKKDSMGKQLEVNMSCLVQPISCEEYISVQNCPKQYWTTFYVKTEKD